MTPSAGENATSAILVGLEMLALRHVVRQEFELLGEVPTWFEGVTRTSLRSDAAIEIADVFPFLEAFLPDAMDAWSRPPARAESETWTERMSDGAEVHLEATAMSTPGARVLVIKRDERLFMERRLVLQRARELRITHDALSKELERRDVLCHCIVHDLTNPLNTMLGVLSTLEEAPVAENDVALVHLGHEAAIRQRGLIKEILDVFALERGIADTTFHGPAPNLSAAIATARDAVIPSARARRITIDFDVPPSGDFAVVGDDARLQRVLGNLLDNAVKHSPTGGHIKIGLVDEGRFLRVGIDDEGPGVPPELLPRLFEQFARALSSRSGTGLGLYFCRITVQRWGGEIGYEPRPGGGSRFWFRLPKAGAYRSAA